MSPARRWSKKPTPLGALFNGIRYKPKYVLDADLKACFDNINQEALLNKLHTYMAMKQAIKGWRKRGGGGK
jgi:RNA-directed DNA polymerase